MEDRQSGRIHSCCLGASAVGSTFGVPHIGGHLAGHAGEAFSEIIDDPPWDRDQEAVS
jgi:hypothetical protein